MLQERPNVLLIMADQLARRVLGCFGGPVPTPALDRLCQEGISFSQAITPYPVCSPARASIVTGLYPHSHGIVHNVMSQDYPMAARSPDDRGILQRDQTTEGLLHGQGYRTEHRGKWHLSGEPLACYARMYRETQEYAAEMHAAFAAARQANQTVMRWYGWTLPVEVAPAIQERFGAEGGAGETGAARLDEFTRKMGRLCWPEERHFDYQVTSQAIRCIEEAAAEAQPFLVTCSLNNPHDPNVVPDPYYQRFDPAAIELPPSFAHCSDHHRTCVSRVRSQRLGEAGVREFLRIYYAQVAMVDRQVQRLLAALDRCGGGENTLVIFTSDHGDMAGSHGMTWKSTEAFYEEVVRVPLLLRWPAQLKPGADERCANLVDLLPTILDAAAVRPFRPVQGYSLLQTPPRDHDAYAVSERMRHDPATRQVAATDPLSIMLRTPRVKLVHYANGDEELFDLAGDPDELVNRVADPAMAPERDRLGQMLLDWMVRTAHPHADQYQAMADAAILARVGRECGNASSPTA